LGHDPFNGKIEDDNYFSRFVGKTFEPDLKSDQHISTGFAGMLRSNKDGHKLPQRTVTCTWNSGSIIVIYHRILNCKFLVVYDTTIYSHCQKG
jgi:hypothetical protein